LKQCCAVERAQVRSARARRNHTGLAIRAFFTVGKGPDLHRNKLGEAKVSITRDAIRAYLAKPTITLGATAQLLTWLT